MFIQSEKFPSPPDGKNKSLSLPDFRNESGLESFLCIHPVCPDGIHPQYAIWSDLKTKQNRGTEMNV